MATEALLELGKEGAMMLLGKLKDDIMGNKYGDASEAVEAILAAQKASFDRLELKVESVVTQQPLDEEFIRIKTWTIALQEGMKKKSKGSEDALNALYAALRDPNQGVLHSLTTIDAILRGSASAYANAAVLDLFQDKIYRDLDSHDRPDYTIANYLKAVVDHLEAHVVLQGTGLMLRIAAADKFDDIGKWERDMAETLRRQVDHAYNKLPALIKRMKPNFKTPMHAPHWWRFKETEGRNREWLERNFTIFGKMTNGFDTGSDGPNPKSEWRFHPALDQFGEITIQTRTDKAFIGEYYTAPTYSYPYGGSSGGWSVTFVGGDSNQRVKGKVVPLRGNEPRFRFVADVNVREMNPLKHNWEINDDGVGQWE
ncbi:hypothetical protein BDN70DRAFT_883731 [Pholiota conissans]|uniref:Uncharacterized protein n=1 Tax=Pholiota conissans TaxID=109636 RepID=A0A9P5YTB8_9AGAR|nr:hypothetical protein BDN70DRAFT_883731 [Pholiota conissans]